ncbi:MAG: hypothetical protein IKV59_03540 [Lachnospiraceae bacterium]|nr:hypothetical protein [Lachnospiraceae bacterium]
MMMKKWLALSLAAMMTVAVTGCGGSYRSGKTNDSFHFEPDFSSGDEADAEENETAEEGLYVKTGSIVRDMYGSLTWYQYGYDENGILLFEREHSEYDSGYWETSYNTDGQVIQKAYHLEDGTMNSGEDYMYDEQGNLIGVKNSLASEESVDVEYSYEYNEAGKVSVRYQLYGEQKEKMLSEEYFYDDAGNLTSTREYYGSDDVWTEKIYDTDGKLLSSAYCEMGSVTGSSSYEYDENGNVIKEKVSNFLDGEYELTYGYEFGEEGELISKTTYNTVGDAIGSIQNVYAVKDPAVDVYTYEELLAQVDVMNGETQVAESEENSASNSQEENEGELAFDFTLWEDYVRAGKTMFTFGYFSPRFAELKSIHFEKAGVDDEGQYFHSWIKYRAETDEFSAIAKVYYEIKDNGSVAFERCFLYGGSENITDYLDQGELMQDYVSPYVWSGNYYKAVVHEPGADPYWDKNVYYTPSAFYAGIFNIRTNGDTLLRNGKNTTESSDKEDFDFCLQICWDDTGMVDTYYCRSLDDKTIVQACKYDSQKDEILSADVYVHLGSLPAGTSEETLERIKYAE